MANIFTKYLNTLNELTKAYNKNKQAIKEVGVEMKKSPITDSASLRKYKKEVEKLSKEVNTQTLLQKERVKIQKQLETAIIKSVSSDRKYTKALTEQKLANQENLKLQKLQIQWQKAGAGSVKKLELANKLLIKRLKEVNQTTEQGRKKALAYQKVIDNNKTRMGQMTGATKKYNSGLQRLSASLKKVGIMMLGAFGVRAAFRGLQRMFDVTVQFEKAQSKLASILGTTKDQIGELTASSKKYGSTTAFTASEVSGLQTELAKLGFITSEILYSTGGILDLAAATGTDLARAAEISGSALRAFGLDASEMGRVTDVMAASTSQSALTMEKLATALPKVAPIAKQFGFSIEETTALLGKLSDSGFDASMMGTSLRNILLNLANSNGTLAKKLGGSVNSFDELIPALVKLRGEGVDLNTTLQLTDKRSVAAFATFLDGAESADELKTSLEGAGGAAKRMAEEQLDNVAGSTIKLKSAWEGLILSISDGSGTIKTATDYLTILVNELNKVIAGEENLSESYRKQLAVQKASLFDLEDSMRKRIDTEKGIMAYMKRSYKAGTLLKEQYIKENFDLTLSEAEIYKQVIAKGNAQILVIESTAHDRRIRETKKKIDENKALIEKADKDGIDKHIQKLKDFEKVDQIDVFNLGGYDPVKSQKIVKDYKQWGANIDALDAKLKELTDTQDELYTGSGVDTIDEDTGGGGGSKGNDAKLKAQAAFDLKMRTFGIDGREKELEDLKIWYEKQKADFIKFGGDMELLEFERLQKKDEIDTKYKEEKVELLAIEWGDEVDGEADKEDRITAKQVEEYQKRKELRVRQIEYLQEINASAFDVANQLASNAEREKLKNENLTDAQREVIEKKAFKKRQAIAIAEIGVNLALELSSIAAKRAADPLNITVVGLAASTALAASLSIKAIIGAAAASAMVLTQKFEHGGTWVEGGQRHSQGGNVYGNKEFEKGEMGAIFSRPATKKYGSEIESFTNAANNLKLQQFYDNKTDVDFGETNGYLKQLVNNSNREIISSDGRVIGKREGNSTTWYD